LSWPPSCITDEESNWAVFTFDERRQFFWLGGKVQAGLNLAIRQITLRMKGHKRSLARPAKIQVRFMKAGTFAQLAPGFLQRDIRGSIKDKSQGTLIVMRDQQNDGPLKILIVQIGRRDEQLSLQ
jgi:hypothetical protein